jgi:pimeloyl-ACP methyl ester carboxylesterase
MSGGTTFRRRRNPMPAVFVHGVPETHHIWDPIREKLSRKDTIAVDMPGFSTEVPEGFACTKEDYLGWLIAEVEKIGEPVDIVGHDWGALLTERLVSVRPDLVRTWAAGGGAIDETYTWHQVAQMWQTPGLGEQVMEGFTVDALVDALKPEGVPESTAREMALRVDDRMKASVLPLYRSAVKVGEEWGPDLDKVARPGLLIWGAQDPYMAIDYAKRLAARTKAEMVVLEDVSHWWPVQAPDRAAEALEAFWAKQS